MKKIIIVGAGAAGCFAAVNAARRFPANQYILLEAGQKPLTKVLVSGGGRCNVTHHCFEPHKFVVNYPRGQKELIGPMHRFGAAETFQWFAKEGIELITEKDGRVFPSTHKSSTIRDCLLHLLEKYQVKLLKGVRVKEIVKNGHQYKLLLAKQGEMLTDMLMLCTGSSPHGYEFAQSLGHSIVEPVPSLFTFKINDALINGLQGLSVPFATATLTSIDSAPSCEKWREQGPLLITHWGLSGPVILKLSAFAARFLHTNQYQATLTVNWLGDMPTQSCFATLWQHSQEHRAKSVFQDPQFSLPKRLWQKFVEKIEHKTWGELSKSTLRSLSEALCEHKMRVEGKGIFKEEFVTCGGVMRKEIDFSRMESRISPSLFFSGEIIDIDGVTGGFNFQNAWTGSWIASQYLG